ncbi:hypothetical protein SDC9_123920 [bioreactor metagenome]|uniref:NodB homology domain-containing protein n=1 Tax=bioreactor metagenome TaxID=1076179 RepID=A0A645CIZ6_9ZZZZ
MKKRERIPALISFDAEEFDLPKEYGAAISPEEQNAVSAEGTAALLDFLDREAMGTATFFVTVRFARDNPVLVRRMVQGGHELASHGMSHSDFKLGDLAESRRMLSEIGECPVTGFRPARLLAVDKQAIADAGYRYESALNPVWIPGRYNHFFAPLKPFRESCGLWQIPVTAIGGIRFPLFWLSFKTLPLGLYCRLARFAARCNGVFNLYTHPWEYNKRSRSSCWNVPRYITRHAGYEQMLRLAWLRHQLARDCAFMTFSAYLDRKERS